MSLRGRVAGVRRIAALVGDLHLHAGVLVGDRRGAVDVPEPDVEPAGRERIPVVVRRAVRRGQELPRRDERAAAGEVEARPSALVHAQPTLGRVLALARPGSVHDPWLAPGRRGVALDEGRRRGGREGEGEDGREEDEAAGGRMSMGVLSGRAARRQGRLDG